MMPSTEPIPFPAGTTDPAEAHGAAATNRRAAPGLWTRRSTTIAIFVVLAFVGLAAARWLATGSVVPWDSKNHFYPMFRFLADGLARGEIPFWNPYHFAGHPTVADPQSLLFTPSLVGLALVAPHASMQLFDAVILAHLAFGGLCILGLFRRRAWHPAGAVLAALVFILGGAACSRLQHTGMIVSYAFFPAALLSLELALERRSWRWALVFGVAAALMALGRDQVAFLLCIVLLARVAWEAFGSRRPLAYLWARSRILLLGGGTAAVLLAVPVLLTIQFLDASNRPGITYGVAAAGSLAPFNLVTLFAPDFFGSLERANDYWGPDYVSMTKPDWTDRAINYLFVGTLPILLVVWHGLAAGRLFERPIRFVLVVLTAALVYALGRYTPIFAIAFDWVPGVALYRRPADATFLVNIALACAAGFLLHRYIEDGVPRAFRIGPRHLAGVRAAATLGAVAALIVAGLLFSHAEKHLPASLVEIGVAAVLASGGVLLFCRLGARQTRVIAATLVVALTGAEILWRNAASSLNAEPLDRYSVYAGMRPDEATGLALLRQELAAKAREGQRPRVEILALNGAWQNASMVLELEDTLGYNPLRIDAYERAVGTGQNSEDPVERHYPGTFRGYRSRLASLLGIEYLVLGRPLLALPRHIPRPDATPIYAGRSMYVYELGKAAPRAYFASKVVPVDSALVVEHEIFPDVDTTQAVLVDRSSLPYLRAPYPSDGALDAGGRRNISTAGPIDGSRVVITRYGTNSVEIDVATDRAGIVVLHDLYYPGWEVRVDGEPAAVLRTNILFRGVQVPPGHHRIEFAFRPLSIANLGAALSGHFGRRRP